MKSLKFNFIMNMLLTVSNFLFPLITFPYISRILQAEGVGKISFATSMTAYFILVAQLGIPTYGVRACAKVRNDREKLSKTVQEIFVINAVMSVIAYLFIFLIYFKVDKISQEGTLFLIMSLPIIFNLIGMEWLYKSLEEYTYMTVRSLIFKFLSICMMFLLVHNPEDYIIYGAIIIFGLSAAAIPNFYNIGKYIDFYKIRSNYDFKQHIKPIFVFFALSCAAIIYTNLDSVILGFIHGDEAVGYYSTAVKVKSILLSIVTALGTVLLPRLSFYIQNGERDKFIQVSNKSFKFLLVLSIVMSVYFVLYSKEVIYFLAGESFKESVFPMQIIIPSVIFIGLTNLFGMQMLVPLRKEKLLVYAVIVGAVINLVLNWWLVPNYAYVATAVANLIAEFVVMLVLMYFIRDVLKEVLKGTNYISIILAVVISSVASLGSVQFFKGDFIILVVSSIVFFSICYVILRIFKDELVMEIENFIFKRFKR